MEKIDMDLDLFSISAYSDPAYTGERELWRGFLAYALPSLLTVEEELIEDELANAIVHSLEELSVDESLSVNYVPRHKLIRYISAVIAYEVGMSADFGIAAFLEGRLPTKLHEIRKKYIFNKNKVRSKKPNNTRLVSRWLSTFSITQKKTRFVKMKEEWAALWEMSESNDKRPEEISEKPLLKAG